MKMFLGSLSPVTSIFLLGRFADSATNWHSDVLYFPESAALARVIFRVVGTGLALLHRRSEHFTRAPWRREMSALLLELSDGATVI